MKRLSKVFLGVILVLSLALFASCSSKSKSEEAKKAEELINNIGVVTYDSGDAIAAAENYYVTLSESDKDDVENADVLNSARNKYNELFAGINNVEAAIDAIGEVTYDSEIAIAYAQDAYTALSSEEQALVSNVDVLLEALEQHEAIVTEYEDNLDNLVDALYDNMYNAKFVDNYYVNKIASSFCTDWKKVFANVDMDLVAYNPDLLEAVNSLKSDVDSVISLLSKNSSRSSIVKYTSKIEKQVEDIMNTYLHSHIDEYNKHYSSIVDPL